MPSRATSPYRNHRFPPEIIAHAVWLYHRFSLTALHALQFLFDATKILSDSAR
jgi:putative transposase